MEPLISVIIPIYNVEKYLDRCIESVVNQTHKNLEIILVDDGSPDNCPQICDAWAKKDNRVKVIHKENGGLSSARNAGLDMATGDYIGFIDSDDYISLDTYKTLLKIIVEQNVMVSGVNAICFNEGEKPSEIKGTKELHKTDYFTFVKGLLTRKTISSVCSKLFDRKLCENARFKEGRTNEDSLFLFYLFLEHKCDFVYTDEIHYYYMTRMGSICRQAFSSTIPSMFKNYKEMEEHIINNKLNMENEVEEAIIYACEIYLLKVPQDKFKSRDLQTCEVIDELKNKRKSIKNTNLRIKDKAFLQLFLICPKLARALSSIIS